MATAVTLAAEDLSINSYPDGGLQAWLVVLGSWACMITSMGLLNTMAVLQARLSENELKHLPESTIGWILSSYAFFLYFCGAQVGPIFDAYDVKYLVIPGNIGIVISMMLIGLCKEFYQFFLCFGLLGGASASLLFNPAIAIIGHYFDKRRALATGIACTAGGLGGILFPVIILYLTPQVGFPWATRVIAFICLAMGCLATALMKKRLPHNKNTSIRPGSAIDLAALRDPKYALTTLAVFLVEFAVFIPYTYISSYAIHAGMPTQRAYLLNALVNVGAIPGRALPGYAADRFGAFNVLALTATTCAALIFALWYTAGTNEAEIYSFTVLYGFWSGAAISVTPVCISRVCNIEDIGKRTGTAFFIASFGVLIGLPIAGAILKADNGSYSGVIVFAGCFYAATVVTLYIARGVAAGWGLRVIF
ncbi:major facilitator superfamily domain-containing protein [Trichoderma aethiopicum]